MSSILPHARQVTHNTVGGPIVLPAHVFKFDIGPEGFELTEEEEHWLLLGEEYQFPPLRANSSLLLQVSRGEIIHEYGEYEGLRHRSEELRTMKGMVIDLNVRRKLSVGKAWCRTLGQKNLHPMFDTISTL